MVLAEQRHTSTKTDLRAGSCNRRHEFLVVEMPDKERTAGKAKTVMHCVTCLALTGSSKGMVTLIAEAS